MFCLRFISIFKQYKILLSKIMRKILYRSYFFPKRYFYNLKTAKNQ